MTAVCLCGAPNCGRPTDAPSDPFCALHEADRTAHGRETDARTVGGAWDDCTCTQYQAEEEP